MNVTTLLLIGLLSMGAVLLPVAAADTDSVWPCQIVEVQTTGRTITTPVADVVIKGQYVCV